MTTNLDDIEEIKNIDKANVLGSIKQLAKQCQQAGQEVSKMEFPENYKKITAVVFSGMGGSALGAYVLKSLYFDQLKVPFEVINDYHLPPYVGENTLVVLGSYSGGTEETLSCAKEAIEKKSQATGLTTGGALAELLKNNSSPTYIFNPIYNPSKQPRLGSGYMIFGLISLFRALDLLTLDEEILDELVTSLETGNNLYGIKNPLRENPAKQLAQKWFNKIPIVVGAEFLANVGRVIRNQLHESSKNFADYYPIPELNHHLMEGLKNPPVNKELLEFLFLNSNNYSLKIQKRMEITKEVVSKNGIRVENFTPNSSDRLTQAFECIQFGAYTNYYLALIYGLDPSKIPWVDYFKEKLAQA